MKSLNASVLNFIRTYIDIIKKKTIYNTMQKERKAISIVTMATTCTHDEPEVLFVSRADARHRHNRQTKLTRARVHVSQCVY